MRELVVLFAYVFGMFAFLLVFSAVLEAVVEFIFARWADYSIWLSKHKNWLIPTVAITLGIIGSFVYRLDVLFLFGKYFEAVIYEIAGQAISLNIPQSVLGTLITGVFLARGSSFVHEFFKKYLKVDLYKNQFDAFGEPSPQE